MNTLEMAKVAIARAISPTYPEDWNPTFLEGVEESVRVIKVLTGAGYTVSFTDPETGTCIAEVSAKDKSQFAELVQVFFDYDLDCFWLEAQWLDGHGLDKTKSGDVCFVPANGDSAVSDWTLDSSKKLDNILSLAVV